MDGRSGGQTGGRLPGGRTDGRRTDGRTDAQRTRSPSARSLLSPFSFIPSCPTPPSSLLHPPSFLLPSGRATDSLAVGSLAPIHFPLSSPPVLLLPPPSSLLRPPSSLLPPPPSGVCRRCQEGATCLSHSTRRLDQFVASHMSRHYRSYFVTGNTNIQLAFDARRNGKCWK